ncbi:DUF1254 domain-containing protein [Methanooceanicella nereidis]|nr:DUF1254 domain-containing protein [Methanocella sp. CWC-04]
MAMTVDEQKSGISRETDTSSDYAAREKDAYTIGVQAYIYGLAPVIMERTEKLFVTMPGAGHASINQFGHKGRLTTPNDTEVVTPNVDTLYSIAWLELGNGPIILHVPDTDGRYYVMQLMDAYTNNLDSIGRRTTGTGEGNFAIIGPGWNGSLPEGLNPVRSPTNTVWIIGRVLVNGESDIPAVRALQEQFTLTPLDQFGKPAASVKDQTLSDFNKMFPSTEAQEKLKFFEELRVALKNNPPPKGEEALMAIFDRIGLRKNETPYGNDLDHAMADGLSRAVKDGDQIAKTTWATMKGISVNGWTYLAGTGMGIYGYDYLLRAAVADGGLGAVLPQEAIYAKSEVDSDGQQLNGANKYIVHFDKDNMPSADAFWSLTMYDSTTYLLVPNAKDRYAIGDRTSGLKYESDGSLDIYIQHDPPSGSGSNWLPAPEGDFYLILRMYQPKPDVLEGKYPIPPVQKVG